MRAPAVPPSSPTPARPSLLVGPVAPWQPWHLALLGVIVTAALALRLYHLSSAGFADDEVHKWLAAQRYLHGDFGGDDAEHPPLMKALIALCALVLPRTLTPEALTRLPNALAGGASAWVLAQLGRRLFGRAAGLMAAALFAVGATAVGYGRIAKEDTLLTLFLLGLLWCLAEAKASADTGRPGAARRWERCGAAALAGMLVSKYLPFLAAIPLLAAAWLRRGGSTWRVPPRRWLTLALLSFAVFLCVDWPLFLPSTWRYLYHYVAGDAVGDRASSETLLFMGRLYNNLGLHYRGGTPTWFHLVFAAVKLSPPVVVLSALGLALAVWRRDPAHRIVLCWMGFLFFCYSVFSAKYGRYFIPLLPAFLLLSAHAAAELARFASRGRGSRALGSALLVGLAAAAVAVDLKASLDHAPTYRLYINAFGGGDARVDYFFPHCDYFDEGAREAFQWVAAHAEPGAEVANEIDWVARYYLGQAGRSDLTSEPILPRTACRRGRPCYLVVQAGRLYGHNQAALLRLSASTPAYAVSVGGHSVARVYRLEPGSKPFPEPSLPVAEGS